MRALQTLSHRVGIKYESIVFHVVVTTFAWADGLPILVDYKPSVSSVALGSVDGLEMRISAWTNPFERQDRAKRWLVSGSQRAYLETASCLRSPSLRMPCCDNDPSAAVIASFR